MISGVTGGAGFVGAHLVDALVRAGDRVRVLDSLEPTGSTEDRRLHRLDAVGATLHRGDIRDPAAVRPFVAGLDRIFHLARLGPHDPTAAMLDVHGVGTQTLLDAMDQEGVRNLTLRSTHEVYGAATEVHEGLALCPRSPLGSTFAAAEALAQGWSRRGGHALQILRVFPTHGPRMPADNVIRRLLWAQIRNRSTVVFGIDARIDPVFVGDVIRALVVASALPSEDPLVIDIASPDAVTSLDVVQAVRRITGDTVQVEEGPQSGALEVLPRSRGVIARAHGIEPRTSLEDALRYGHSWLQRRAPLRQP